MSRGGLAKSRSKGRIKASWPSPGSDTAHWRVAFVSASCSAAQRAAGASAGARVRGFQNNDNEVEQRATGKNLRSRFAKSNRIVNAADRIKQRKGKERAGGRDPAVPQLQGKSASK